MGRGARLEFPKLDSVPVLFNSFNPIAVYQMPILYKDNTVIDVA